MNNNETLPNNVKRGDFPFPLTKGPVESRYLTWLRNHSNYMAAGGFMDYLRIGGVLVRGILINFLILLSLLLLVSLAVGYLYRAELRPPWDPDDVHEMLGWVLSEKTPLNQWMTRSLSLEDDYKKALVGLKEAQADWWIADNDWRIVYGKLEAPQSEYWKAEEEWWNAYKDKTNPGTSATKWKDVETE